MSVCARCGARFGCAMVDGEQSHPCWCTQLPPVVPVPRQPPQQQQQPGGQPAAAIAAVAAEQPPPDSACWCPACLRQHIAAGRDS